MVLRLGAEQGFRTLRCVKLDVCFWSSVPGFLSSVHSVPQVILADRGVSGPP